MNERLQRLRQAWGSRSPREQQMLAIMIVSIAAFVLWFGVATPLRSWSDAAQQRHAVAAAGQAPLQQALDAIAVEDAASGGAAFPDANALIQSARELGLAATLASPAPERGIGLQFEAADAQSLFAWLQQQRERGVHPRQVDIDAGDAGLRAELVFMEDRP